MPEKNQEQSPEPLQPNPLPQPAAQEPQPSQSPTETAPTATTNKPGASYWNYSGVEVKEGPVLLPAPSGWDVVTIAVAPSGLKIKILGGDKSASAMVEDWHEQYGSNKNKNIAETITELSDDDGMLVYDVYVTGRESILRRVRAHTFLHNIFTRDGAYLALERLEHALNFDVLDTLKQNLNDFIQVEFPNAPRKRATKQVYEALPAPKAETGESLFPAPETDYQAPPQT